MRKFFQISMGGSRSGSARSLRRDTASINGGVRLRLRALPGRALTAGMRYGAAFLSDGRLLA